MHYLIRFQEGGREAQPQRHKIRHDIVTSIEAAIPGARIATANGRVFLEVAEDDGSIEETESILAGLFGVASFSPVVRCARDQLTDQAVAFATTALADARSFRVRAKAVGGAAESTRAVAAELGRAICARMPAIAVDLSAPEVVLGVELRDEGCFIFDRVVPGRERRTDRQQQAGDEPRLLVDQMLGHLVGWLRILGFDTVFMRDHPDSVLLRRAAREGRVLITRDGPLGQVQSADVLFLRSEEPTAQLRELVEALQLPIQSGSMFTRCSLCNRPVQPVAKEEVRERIPEAAYREYDEFTTCLPCDKVYWKGGQYDRIMDSLAGLSRE